MSAFRKHFFLIIGLLLLALGGFLHSIFSQESGKDAEIHAIENVQIRVNEVLRQSENDLALVRIRYAAFRDTSFSALSISTRYPYFIFQDGQLQYWSDYRFVPEYNQVKGRDQARVITHNGSYYLINKASLSAKARRIEIVSLIPVFQRYPIDNQLVEAQYNPDLFASEPQALRLTPTDLLYAIHSQKGEFLFALCLASGRTSEMLIAVFLLVSLALVCLSGYTWNRLKGWHRQRNYELGVLALGVYLMVIRGTMVFFEFPTDFFATSLDASLSGVYLTNLMLNALSFDFVLLYLTLTFFRSRLYLTLIHATPLAQISISVALVVGSYAATERVVEQLKGIYAKSGFLLDMHLSLTHGSQGLRWACLGAFILLSCLYFMASHLIIRLFSRLNPQRSKGLLWVASGSAIAMGLAWVVSFSDLIWLLIGLNGSYFILVYMLRLPGSLYFFRYRTSLYLFAGAGICAMLGASTAFQQASEKEVLDKQSDARKYGAENDSYGEFLLDRMNQELSQDTVLSQIMQDSILARERIQQRLRQAHLDTYFDGYSVELAVFDSKGVPLDPNPGAQPLAYYTKHYAQASYQTRYQGLYFLPAAVRAKGADSANSFQNQYMDFVTFGSASSQRTTLVLDLKLSRMASRAAFRGGSQYASSELLMGTRQDARYLAGEATGYGHAVYTAQHQLIKSAGPFNYKKYLPAVALADSQLFKSGLVVQDYQHVGVLGSKGKIIVVSSPYQVWLPFGSSFSYLFLVLGVLVMAMILGYAFRHRWKRNFTFTAQIQLYLHLGFLLPLLVVMGIVIDLIGGTLLDDQAKAYRAQSLHLSSSLSGQLEAYFKGQISRGYLEQELKKLSVNAGREVSVFSDKGRLMLAGQPEVYALGLLSPYLNPAAYKALLEDHESIALLNESVGKTDYKTAYIPLIAAEGKLLGVMSVAYYEAGMAFESQMVSVVGSILITFTVIFMGLLVLSYFASRVLTVPLRLITQKIRRTNLDQLNESLKWESADEIGMLVNEYNKMLAKLEDNKQALSQSEKQAAWQEMAKQVAHEIKNPLTPMKLTLQQLQRILPADNPATRKLIDRSFNSLIHQVDTISDIANSFSDFAKMPVPKNELFDLVPVVRNAVALYSDDRSISLQMSIQPRQAYIWGDAQLMGRTLTNLLINAIQAVPDTRKPELKIMLESREAFVLLSVRDNGSGIAEDIRQRVFMPSFSTKENGNGVGLAVAKRGIEHANGSIWFETEEGLGTTFFISLPLTQSPRKRANGVSRT